MNKNYLVFMGVVALAVIVSAVMLRYDTTQPNAHGMYTKTDRWTGTVLVCSWSTCKEEW